MWPLRITELTDSQATEVAARAWRIIERLQVSTSGAQIVAGTKFIHHLLPDLIPPIDRQYTVSFFTVQKAVDGAGSRLVQNVYPQLATIGARCRQPILEAIKRCGFMAAREAKVIDNAIMRFMQDRKESASADEEG